MVVALCVSVRFIAETNLIQSTRFEPECFPLIMGFLIVLTV